MDQLFTRHADLLLELGLHFLWQGTVIAILAWLACLLVFRNPSQRSVIYLMALLAMPVAIVVTYLMMDAGRE